MESFFSFVHTFNEQIHKRMRFSISAKVFIFPFPIDFVCFRIICINKTKLVASKNEFGYEIHLVKWTECNKHKY